ncbi:MAG: 8-amino-7-oxononanoate synthase [Terrimicrobiaceae bacterium]|nr:8-amino-7-oxononanoate synthase [Terrimicrobiaceae bacterium]
MSDLDRWLGEKLACLESQSLLRRLRVLDSPQQPVVLIDGRQILNFSSNDYLGLAADDRVREAGMAAIKEYGVGAGASRLICGTLRPHAALEDALAQFKRSEAALTFSTGFATALGAVPALVGSDDVVILDKLCHACLVDAARMSGAAMRIFPHNDIGKLESHLRWARAKHSAAQILILTESVFSMDGDLAPLREIVELKDRHGAWLLVDEAHGVGVLGARGRGLADATGVADRIEIQMGTLGKALGASGGYICGSRKLADFFINRARTFIFSTAPPPASAAAAAAAVTLLDSGEAEPLRDRLWSHIRMLASAIGTDPSSAILPVRIGDERRALDRASALLEEGFLVPAIRHPTVARGAARLRVTVSAAHTAEQVASLAATIRRVRAIRE